MWARPTYWFDNVNTTILRFSKDGVGDDYVTLEAPDNISSEEYTYKISKINNWLKPHIKIVPSLNESEDKRLLNILDNLD